MGELLAKVQQCRQASASSNLAGDFVYTTVCRVYALWLNGLAVSPLCGWKVAETPNDIAAWTNKVGTGLPPPVRWQKRWPGYTVGGTVVISRSRAVAARLAHNQEDAGSSPASATSPYGANSPPLIIWRSGFPINLPTGPPLFGDIAQLVERWLCKP